MLLSMAVIFVAVFREHIFTELLVAKCCWGIFLSENTSYSGKHERLWTLRNKLRVLEGCGLGEPGDGY